MAPDPPGFIHPALTIPPLSPPHLSTMILLHGRGLSAHTFGPDLISTPFQAPYSGTTIPALTTNTTPPEEETLTTLRALLPHTKIIFPLAPRHRATIYARSIIHQWFDGWHLTPDHNHNHSHNPASPPSSSDSNSMPHSNPASPPSSSDSNSMPHSNPDLDSDPDPDSNPDLIPIPTSQTQPSQLRIDTQEWRAIAGLQDTVAYLHRLIRAEAAPVGGPGNIILGGLSQGCAASLVALLLWDGEALGGYVGMCGWLVFERGVRGALFGGGENGGGEEFDPFEREGGDDDDGDRDGDEVVVEAKVVRVLREMLELEDRKMPTSRPRVFDTPVFLGHGTEDDKVPAVRGQGAAECLRAAGVDAEYKVYDGLGHWYSSEMLADMAAFLTHKTNWEQHLEPS